jgi:hypothetical protein
MFENFHFGKNAWLSSSLLVSKWPLMQGVLCLNAYNDKNKFEFVN